MRLDEPGALRLRIPRCEAASTKGGSEIASFEAGRGREISDLQDRRDRELLGRVAGGSEDALAEFYRRYASAAAGLAYRVLGDAVHAEEVVQEVFISVWRSSGSYDPARGSVRSWLFAQIHHRSVDVIRREEAERRRAVHHGAPLVEDPLEDVIEEGWIESRRGDVKSALAALPAEQREVLELAYYSGMTQRQIAAKSGTPLGTVKTRTLAAMRSMRTALVARAGP